MVIQQYYKNQKMIFEQSSILASPIPSAIMSSQGESLSALVNTNEQLRLINQLNERRIGRMEKENQALHERVRALTSDDDQNRLKLLLADKERRRLTRWKALVSKTVSMLTISIREFEGFVAEIDQGVEDLVRKGAMNPEFEYATRPPRKTSEFNRQLAPIAESPLVSASTLIDESPHCSANVFGNSASVSKTPVENIAPRETLDRGSATVSVEKEEAIEQSTAQPQARIPLNVTYVVMPDSKSDENVLTFKNGGIKAVDNEAAPKNDFSKSRSLSEPYTSVLSTSFDSGEVFHSNNNSIRSLFDKNNVPHPLITSTPKEPFKLTLAFTAWHNVPASEFPSPSAQASFSDAVLNADSTPKAMSVGRNCTKRSGIPIYISNPEEQVLAKKRKSILVDFKNHEDFDGAVKNNHDASIVVFSPKSAAFSRETPKALNSTLKERTLTPRELTPRPNCGPTNIPAPLTPHSTKKITTEAATVMAATTPAKPVMREARPKRAAAKKIISYVTNYTSQPTSIGSECTSRVRPRRSTRRPASTSLSSAPVSNSTNIVRRAVNSAVAFYEECIGLAEVHKARSEVTQCEERLYEAQQERRQKQSELKKLQNRLKEIHTELDRTARGEDRYLHLLTEEHAAIKKEQSLLVIFEELENREREAFSLLSNKVRASHEREREREERTKYWSLTASLIGAFFGILGTSLGNELRMRRFREMIPTSQEVRPVLEELTQIIHKEQKQIAGFVKDIKEAMRLEDSAKLHPIDIRKAGGNTDQIISLIKDQNAALINQLNELKRLIRLDQSLAGVDPDRVVYVGDEVETLLRKTEGNIESKMKLQTLVSVVCFYAVVGLVAPIIYLALKKD